MGCFLACFGGAKDRKQRRRRSRKPKPINRVTQDYQPLQIQASPSPQKPEAVAVVPVPEPRENQEQGISSSCRKKVTFDLNVRTYENVTVYDPLEEDERVKEVKEERETKVGSDPNYRYQNCESSDDDDDEGLDDDEEEVEYDVSDFEDEEDEAPVVVAEEESYDSFFSLPIDKEKQQQQQQRDQSNCEEVDSPVPVSISTKGSARDRSQYVHSVLNPVENLSQWKEVKVGALPLKTPVKENIVDKENNRSGLENRVTGFSPQPRKPRDSTREEISVDASLSTWLVSSEEKSPKGAQGSNSQWSNSSVSREDQPILGALTVEDLKHSSVTSSPRRSPNKNPDEMPILGTVGSYWNSKAQFSESKGIPNTTSKYREDKKVNWHSTPFEVRLERALNKGSAEACPR